MKKLYQIITSKNPLQLDFEFSLWTRSIIRELIRERFDVRLSDVSVGRLLRKLGLSPQKPLYRAYQRDEEKVNAWKEKATIYFGDEASVRSDHHYGTTWLPVGKTPVIMDVPTGFRQGVNNIMKNVSQTATVSG
ncbi:MAG: winged helix-turn-helix domain-containing protein [Ectothiorhodospiraceae bacterium]|nr:winged helix-turn-helix domain-containing protein [Ectothiorhodospiraceae bacterium]